MKNRFFLISILIILGLCLSTRAEAVEALKGLAILKLKTSRTEFELEQAAIVTPQQAIFQVLDDMGGEVFRVDMKTDKVIFQNQGKMMQSKKSSLKNVLSLPISREEFLGILRYVRPDTFNESCSCGTEPSWTPKDKRKIKVLFSDLVDLNPQTALKGNQPQPDLGSYPKHIRIEYKKYFFDLRWQTLEAK